MYLCLQENKSNDTQPMKFAPSVLLINTSYLNRIIADLNQLFSHKLQRELDLIHPGFLFTYFCLDARFPKSDKNSVHALLIRDETSAHFPQSCPSDIDGELDNMAFLSPVGEITCYAFRPEGMSDIASFMAESLRCLAEAPEVERIALLDDVRTSPKAEEFHELITASTGNKEITLFDMDATAEDLPAGAAHHIIAYPVMKALGIHGHEV